MLVERCFGHVEGIVPSVKEKSGGGFDSALLLHLRSSSDFSFRRGEKLCRGSACLTVCMHSMFGVRPLCKGVIKKGFRFRMAKQEADPQMLLESRKKQMFLGRPQEGGVVEMRSKVIDH